MSKFRHQKNLAHCVTFPAFVYRGDFSPNLGTGLRIYSQFRDPRHNKHRHTHMHARTHTYIYVVLVVQLCLTLCNPTDYSPPGSSVHGNSPGKNTGLGCHALLQQIFPTQGSNPSLSHCRQILYQLSHQGSPRRLEWVAYPFSRGTSQPRDQTGVSYIAGGFFTS